MGLVGFRVKLDHAGDAARVIVYLSAPAPTGAKWYHYTAIDGWQDYGAYATFGANRRSVTLEIKDGGHGDTDGAANGVIVDPSGLGVAAATSEPTPAPPAGSGSEGGGGGGGCFIHTVP